MTITIKGVTELKGNLMLAIFDKTEGFGYDDFACHKMIIKPIKIDQQIKLSHLVLGKKYAIAVYHDINNNQRLDKNILGMPIEKYGFSNDARGTFGPPSFESTYFIFGAGDQLSITLK